MQAILDHVINADNGHMSLPRHHIFCVYVVDVVDFVDRMHISSKCCMKNVAQNVNMLGPLHTYIIHNWSLQPFSKDY